MNVIVTCWILTSSNGSINSMPKQIKVVKKELINKKEKQILFSL
jgi:hypothetical protein